MNSDACIPPHTPHGLVLSVIFMSDFLVLKCEKSFISKFVKEASYLPLLD